MTAQPGRSGVSRRDEAGRRKAAPIRPPTDAGETGLRVVAPALVGRAAELAALAAMVSSPPAVAVVEGEAGVGKTRLVTELAAHPEMAGRRLVVGGGRPIREPFPLGPVIEAVRGMGDDLPGAVLSPVAGALRPLLPELAEWLPPPPAPLDDQAAERHRVFRGLVEVLAALGPAVVMLEDLHWADEQTIEFLRYLFGEQPPGLALVLTFRGEEVDPALRAATARLPASVRRTELALAPLNAKDTGAMATAILDTDHVSEEFAAHLCARTAGLPFAIEEVLALLRARGSLRLRDGRWARRALQALDVPTSIRDQVLERVGSLPEDARAVVEAAAVLQGPMPLPVLTATCDVAGGAAPRGVEQALETRLLVDHGGTVAFRHQLAAQAVYDHLSGPRRQELHGRAADALRRRRPVPLGQLAHHLREAGRLQEWVDAADRAAAQALEVGHAHEAARLLEDVVRHGAVESERRGRLALRLARAANETLHAREDVVELLWQVLNEPLSAPVRGELRLWLALTISGLEDNRPALQRRLLLDAVPDLDDRPDSKAWAMLALGVPVGGDVPLSEHVVWLDRVLETLPLIEDSTFQAFLLGKVGMALVGVGDPGWRSVADRLVDHTAGVPTHRQEVIAYSSLGMVASYVGHHQVADRMLTAARGAPVTRDSRELDLRVQAAAAVLAYCRGDWKGLRELATNLVDGLVDYPRDRVDVEVVAGCLHLAQGDLDNARQRLTDVVRQLHSMGEIDLLSFATTALARLLAARDEPADAAGAMDTFVQLLEGKSAWASAARALPMATRALLAAGREGEARDLLGRCERELAGLDAPLAPAALRYAGGLLAAARGEWTAAGEELLCAASLYEPLDCPYEAAQAMEDAASALWAAGEDARAEHTAREALAVYEGLGASWDAARVTRAARQHEVSVPATHHRGRRGYGIELSPRELQVAEHAAHGLTNKEIAAKLFLSPDTVKKHLSRAMRKIGVSSRRDITPGNLPTSSSTDPLER